MDMHTLTQMTLAFELAEQGLSHTKIAAHLGRHRETIGLWLKGMASYGLTGVLDRHTQAKKGPRRARQVPARIKRLIWELRVREHDCCGQKIAYFLERAEKYVIRPQWRMHKKRGAVPTASRARAIIQMNTVAFGPLLEPMVSTSSATTTRRTATSKWRTAPTSPVFLTVAAKHPDHTEPHHSKKSSQKGAR